MCPVEKSTADARLKGETWPTRAHARNGVRLVIIPHPSRRCVIWQETGAVTWARETLRAAGVLPVPSA